MLTFDFVFHYDVCAYRRSYERCSSRCEYNVNVFEGNWINRVYVCVQYRYDFAVC